jgi:hypothetical protein
VVVVECRLQRHHRNKPVQRHAFKSAMHVCHVNKFASYIIQIIPLLQYTDPDRKVARWTSSASRSSQDRTAIRVTVCVHRIRCCIVVSVSVRVPMDL